MLRLARVIAIAAASGVFLAAPPLAAHAAPPTSFCVPGGTGGFPVSCTMYESKAGVPSEISDIVPMPQPPGAVPSNTAVLVENPSLPQTDPKNWSDVVEFIPQTPGAPFGSPSISAQILSVGCGNLNDPTDISCFPAPAAVDQFIPEVQTGQGNDFTDCTQYPVIFQGQVAIHVTACSDSPAVESGDTLPVPEVPLPILLPLAGLGLVAVVGFRKLRRRTT